MELILEGDYTEIERNAINQHLNNDEAPISIVNADVVFGITTLISIGILTVAIANFLYGYEKDRKAKKTWSVKKILEIIEQELLKLGHYTYKNISFENPNNLLNPSQLYPCIIIVVLENDSKISFKLYRTGGIYHISAEKK